MALASAHLLLISSLFPALVQFLSLNITQAHNLKLFSYILGILGFDIESCVFKYWPSPRFSHIDWKPLCLLRLRHKHISKKSLGSVIEQFLSVHT